MPEFLESKISREEENNIKDALREEYSFRENYIESFCIDIKNFVETKEIKREKTYYLFGYNGGHIDITNKIADILKEN